MEEGILVGRNIAAEQATNLKTVYKFAQGWSIPSMKVRGIRC